MKHLIVSNYEYIIKKSIKNPRKVLHNRLINSAKACAKQEKSYTPSINQSNTCKQKVTSTHNIFIHTKTVDLMHVV